MNGLMRNSMLFLLLLVHSASISGYDSVTTKVPLIFNQVPNRISVKLENELSALDLSKSLETKLKNIRNYELGVPILQVCVESLSFQLLGPILTQCQSSRGCTTPWSSNPSTTAKWSLKLPAK